MLTKDFEVIDPRFNRLVIGNVHVEKLATGCRWSEGPAYFPAHRTLVWSDIPNDRVMRWDETSGEVSVFEHHGRNLNGHTVDQRKPESLVMLKAWLPHFGLVATKAWKRPRMRASVKRL